MKVVKYMVTLGLLAMLNAVALNAHGGGCRKNSPQGMCCHEKKATGEVHCHVKSESKTIIISPAKR